MRQLLLALQDATAERDEARAQVARLEAAMAAGAEPGELEALRAENAALRAENANMFTLKEENGALRTQLETARLQLQCLGHDEGESS